MCGTVRTGTELGFNTLVVSDASATLTPRVHDEALLAHARMWGRVATAAAVREELGAPTLAGPTATDDEALARDRLEEAEKVLAEHYAATPHVARQVRANKNTV